MQVARPAATGPQARSTGCDFGLGMGALALALTAALPAVAFAVAAPLAAVETASPVPRVATTTTSAVPTATGRRWKKAARNN
jgi:hypothetical protein